MEICRISIQTTTAGNDCCVLVLSHRAIQVVAQFTLTSGLLSEVMTSWQLEG